MKTVYKITNKINNKIYIGSSTRVNKRWRDHINAAFNENDSQYDYPLYRAFRKYGVENFSFEILKDDFLTIEEMQAYEHYEIIHYYYYCIHHLLQLIKFNLLLLLLHTHLHTHTITTN